MAIADVITCCQCSETRALGLMPALCTSCGHITCAHCDSDSATENTFAWQGNSKRNRTNRSPDVATSGPTPSTTSRLPIANREVYATQSSTEIESRPSLKEEPTNSTPIGGTRSWIGGPLVHSPNPIWEKEDDIQSHAGSVFSAGQSSGTSWTSFSVQANPLTSAGVDQVLLLLFENERLRELCLEALRSLFCGPDRFERNFRRIIRHYGQDLGHATVTTAEEVTAKFVRDQARKIAYTARRQLLGPVNPSLLPLNPDMEDAASRVEKYLSSLNKPAFSSISEDVVDDTEDSSDDNEEAMEERPSTSNLDLARKLLLSSPAIALMCTQLENLIGPTFEARVEEFRRHLARGVDGSFLPTDVLSNVDRILQELKLTECMSIRVLYEWNESHVEALQRKLEQYTNSAWHWWPLNAPPERLTEGNAYITWICPCGEERYEIVPRPFAERFCRLVVQKYMTTSAATSSGTGDANRSDESQSRPIQRPSKALRRSNNSAGNPVRESWDNIEGTGFYEQFASPPKGPDPNRLRLVFLDVGIGDSFKLAQMPVHSLSDDAFFETLREYYEKIRGPLRTMLSIWQYSHCNFMRFERAEFEEHYPIIEELPPDEWPQSRAYEFYPRTNKVVPPPITRHEFKRRFYGCFKCGSWHKCKSAKCQRRCRPKGTALERIPKRDRRLMEDGSDREIYWGILAVETHSFIRVLMYHVLFLLGPLMFWGLWLSVMKHSADLQNASLPLTVFVGFLSVFWAVLGNHRDPHYGRHRGKLA